jgi:uncharacterized membrane protein
MVRRFQLEKSGMSNAGGIVWTKSLRAGYSATAIYKMAVFLITMMANVPINRAIATWSATEPPSA